MYFPSTPISKNYYEILGVNHAATETEIKTAYKKMALKFHPDKASLNNITTEMAEEKFKLISEANEILSNPQKRTSYNLQNSFASNTFPSSSYAYKDDFFSKYTQGFNHGFNHSDFFSGYAKNYKQEKACEDHVCYPKKIPQEIIDIIISDDSKNFDIILKNKKFENSLLESMLYKSCSLGKLNIVKYLIEVKKISAQLKVDDGLPFTGSIFKAAAESGNLLLVKYLFETHHADIESQGLSNGTKDTALCRAAAKGHEEVVMYLIKNGANVNPETSYSSFLKKAFSSDKVSIISLLINAGTKIEDYDLSRALELGNLKIVKLLLNKRPGLESHRSLTSHGYQAIKSGNTQLVKYLEEHEKLDIYEKNFHCSGSILSVLKAGAESKNIEMMKFLLEEKKLENEVSGNFKYIKTILGLAIQTGSKKTNSLEILKFLQFLIEEKQFVLSQEKMKELVKNEAEFSSLEINCYLQSFLTEDEATKILLSTIAAKGLESLDLAELLFLFNSRLITQGKYGDYREEIHFHIKNRNISIDQLRDALIGNQKLMTEALFYYSSYHHKNDLSPLELLVELGVNINAENLKGEVAILVAIHSGGYNKIVQFFIDHKADLSKKNKNGTTIEEMLSNSRFRK